MPNTVPPTADAEQVKIKQQLGEAKSLVDFGVTGVVVQTNTKDILPMAGAGAIGFKIFFGETIGNLPFPDDGMCMEAFDYIAQSKLPLGIHAENRQIMAYCTNKLKTEGKNEARYWEASRPDICEAESVHHAIFFAEMFGTKLHVFHMSSKQAAYMVRDAKARGTRITARFSGKAFVKDLSTPWPPTIHRIRSTRKVRISTESSQNRRSGIASRVSAVLKPAFL